MRVLALVTSLLLAAFTASAKTQKPNVLFIAADDTEELYDVRKDPNEWHNLASDPAYDNTKARMRQRAPKTFAEPAFKLIRQRHLILEGESFRWEVK